MTNEEKPERRRHEATRYLWERWRLSYAPTTLARFASLGKGPVYRKRGPFAFYREEDLDAWALTKIDNPRRKASGPTGAHAA